MVTKDEAMRKTQEALELGKKYLNRPGKDAELLKKVNASDNSSPEGLYEALREVSFRLDMLAEKGVSMPDEADVKARKAVSMLFPFVDGVKLRALKQQQQQRQPPGQPGQKIV